MTIATGVNKLLAFKKQASGLGVLAGTGSAQYLRYVTCGIDLSKDTYTAAEKREDFQTSDMRHGMKKVDGPINCELSGGTYQSFYESALRAAATAIAALTALTLTTVVSSTYTGTITRSAGSFITDGIRKWVAFRVTAGLNAGSLNRNAIVTNVTATVITYVTADGVAAFIAESTVASCTITVPGKRIVVPSTGHTDDYYTIEEYHQDITRSRLFQDCKVSTVDTAFPSTGMATVNFGFMGRDMTSAGAAYFVTPTASTTSGIIAAVNGLLLLNGVPVGLVQSGDYKIDGKMSTGSVIGSNLTPDVFEGRVDVMGNLTIYLQDATFIDGFSAETEFSIVFFFTESSAGNAHFQLHAMPRIKLGGAKPDDGEKGLVQTVPFTALKITAATGVDGTTVIVQDSQYV